MWDWFEERATSSGSLRWGFTSSRGGVSRAGYAELNLGDHVGDAPEAVRANRMMLAQALGVPGDRVRYLDQVHGSDVAFVDGPGAPPRADAMVTTTTDLALAVLVADCVPVLLADPGRGVAAVAHAGRAGFLGGIVPATVAAMRDLGATDIEAVVGPSICGRCYEVPAELNAQAKALVPVADAVSWSGTPAIDLGSGVVAQLREAQVEVRWRPGCTREAEHLYSYRRDGVTGRFAGVLALLTPALMERP